MSYAKTEAGAKRRVAMKRALRRKGISIESDITTSELDRLYHKHLNKALPPYDKYK